MNVLIFSQFFRPEPSAASNRIQAMAQQFTADGHQVTVVTGFPTFPSGRVDEAYRGRRWMSERDGPIRVVRVWTYEPRRMSARDRVLNWLSVAAGAVLVALREAFVAYDVVVVTSPPITLSLAAMLAARLHRCVLVADIRDVWPDLGIASGLWRRGSLVERAVRFVADALYANAGVVLCVTATARAAIMARGVPAEKVVLAPNGFDAVALASEPGYQPAPGEIVVSYIGNMGVANGLDVVLDAALELRGDPRFTFLLIGGGQDAERLRQRIAREGVRNVRMLGVLPRAVAMKTLACADLCIVTLRAAIVDSLPTKLFDALFVGTPVIVSAGGEAARVLEESGGGIAVPPEDPTALAAAVRALADDAHRRARCAQRGRAYVEEHYDRSKVMAALSSRLASLAGLAG